MQGHTWACFQSCTRSLVSVMRYRLLCFVLLLNEPCFPAVWPFPFGFCVFDRVFLSLPLLPPPGYTLGFPAGLLGDSLSPPTSCSLQPGVVSSEHAAHRIYHNKGPQECGSQDGMTSLQYRLSCEQRIQRCQGEESSQQGCENKGSPTARTVWAELSRQLRPICEKRGNLTAGEGSEGA